jgi:hypothetical protein
MEATSELLKQYGGYGEVPEEEFGKADSLLAPNPNYCELIDNLSCHGGVTFTSGCHKATKEVWEKWRQKMLERKAEIEEFPFGDSANAWREDGHLVDDYKAWVADREASSICHLAEPGEPEVTWIGFDCAHAGDLSPKMEADMERIYAAKGETRFKPPHSYLPKDTYKTIEYVQGECRELAKQLKEIDDGNQVPQGLRGDRPEQPKRD